jgi:hypothetical protein
MLEMTLGVTQPLGLCQNIAEIARLICLPVTVLHALMVLYFDENTEAEFVLLDFDGLQFAITILASRSAIWR